MDRPGIEPGSPPRQGGVVPLDHQPVCRASSVPSGAPGSRTPITWVQTKRLSVGPAPQLKRSVRELNPVFRLTTAACARNTYRPSSDPGWNRTSTFLHVTQASSPLDHGIMSATRVSLCQLAFPSMNLKASPIGFEPTASTLTGWRALQAAPRGRSFLRIPKPDSRICRPTARHSGKEGRAGLEPARWYLTGTRSATELPTQ